MNGSNRYGLTSSNLKEFTNMTNREIKLKSVVLRKNILKYIYKAKAGHTGGAYHVLIF